MEWPHVMAHGARSLVAAGLPAVIEPLREKWDGARAAAFTLNSQGKNAEAMAAEGEVGIETCEGGNMEGGHPCLPLTT